MNFEQAEAILRGLATLPGDLDPDLTVKAEEHLIELAHDHDAKALKNLARKLGGRDGESAHALAAIGPNLGGEQ